MKEKILHEDVKMGYDEDEFGEGWYVDIFCGVQWNRLFMYPDDEESTRILAETLLRFRTRLNIQSMKR